MKKWISITACTLHFLFAGSVIAWVAGDWDVPGKKWLIILGVLFVIISIFVATVFLKLDLDKLFLKFETNSTTGCDRIVMLAGGITALVIVGFEILMIVIYFLRGGKMEPAEFVRFTVLPTLALAHLAMGIGGYLSYHYFRLVA